LCGGKLRSKKKSHFAIPAQAFRPYGRPGLLLLLQLKSNKQAAAAPFASKGSAEASLLLPANAKAELK